jgi:hypothetical protein
VLLLNWMKRFQKCFCILGFQTEEFLQIPLTISAQKRIHGYMVEYDKPLWQSSDKCNAQSCGNLHLLNKSPPSESNTVKFKISNMCRCFLTQILH